MERGKYRFEVEQVIKGENGEYIIAKREKRKDNTQKVIQRKWYTLICPNKHKYEIEESHLENRVLRCPSCYHPKIKDVDTVFAAMFVKKEYPYIYTCMSHVKADFYCASCGNVCKDKSIHTVYQRGYVPCKSCGDGRSYGERLFAAILDDLEVEYIYQKRIDWKRARFFYDFQLDNTNILFEIHGCQHYERGFEKLGGRTVQDEKKNDFLKANIALELGYKLIVIDARVSSLNYIRKSIEDNEELKCVIDVQRINWEKVIKTSASKRDLEILRMLKEGEDAQKIANKCSISKKSIPQFKRKFIDHGLWNGISDKDIQKEIEKERVISSIRKLQEKGVKSGDICKKLNINPATFKNLLGMEVFPDPKHVKKWSAEEAIKTVKKNELPVELVSDFIDNRTVATWKCKQCGIQFEATLLGLQRGVKCYQCKGRKKVEEDLLNKFPGEYEILSMYIASEKDMKFKHLICGQEFLRTPHSIKRSVTPCLECGSEKRIKKGVQTKMKNRQREQY